MFNNNSTIIMKNIFKLFLASLLVTLSFVSCENDADRDWSMPEASFKLYDTSLGSNVLYVSMKDNPFVLTWDKLSDASGEYSVVVSATDDFSKKVELGKSSTNTLKTTIGALNSAVLQAGLSPYSPVKVYVRIENGTKVSNAISFIVTAYPSSAPVITVPATGESIILNINLPNDIAKTITWSDYNTYGVDVTYLIEVSKSGNNNFSTLGSVMNAKSFEATNKVLNDAVLKAGLEADVKGEVDVRVTATSKSTGGTIEKVSNIVTFKVTPYVAFKNMFFVGNATAANWNNNNNNQAIFRDASNANKFHFIGKFGAGEFKFLEILGNWQPQWGLKAGLVANSDGGDPGTFVTSAAGYYSFTMDILAKTYTLTPYTDAMTDYSTIGMIGDFNGWGGDLALEQSSYDTHQWTLKDITIPTTGKFKFRADGAWTVNWGAGTELSGQGTQNGADIPLTAGTYDIYFNDIDGRYQFIKK